MVRGVDVGGCPQDRPGDVDLLALPKSRAPDDGETGVAGKGRIPGGTRAAEVDGTPSGFVELRMPAGGAEARLCAELQPRGVGRHDVVEGVSADMHLSLQDLSRGLEPRHPQRALGRLDRVGPGRTVR